MPLPTAFTGGTDNFFTFQNWRLKSRGDVTLDPLPGPLVFDDLLFFTNNANTPYFYDGTDVKELNATNLPSYRDPVEGTLNRALHVAAYGERLIWLRPQIASIDYGQAVLYGPINDNSGRALDYQATGSGILSAVTNSVITGFRWLRDTLIVFFETDVYALELTNDAFAPFRWTRLENERGVEPTHGAVGLLGEVESPSRS